MVWVLWFRMSNMYPLPMKPLHHSPQWLPAMLMLARGLGAGYLSESKPIRKGLADGNTEYPPSHPLREQGWKSQEGLVSHVTLCQENCLVKRLQMKLCHSQGRTAMSSARCWASRMHWWVRALESSLTGSWDIWHGHFLKHRKPWFKSDSRPRLWNLFHQPGQLQTQALL